MLNFLDFVYNKNFTPMEMDNMNNKIFKLFYHLSLLEAKTMVIINLFTIKYQKFCLSFFRKCKQFYLHLKILLL